MPLNPRQRMCLTLAAGLFAVTLVYPPFSLQGISQGFGWIVAPPHPLAIIDVGMLLVEWGALFLLSLVLVLVLGEKGSDDSDGSEQGGGRELRNASLATAIFGLRLVRALFGIVLAFQILGLLPILTWVAAPSDVSGDAIVTVLIKITVAAVATGMVLGLRRLINNLNTVRTGSGDLLIPGTWSF